MDLRLNGVGELVTNHTGNVKVLDAIFACLVCKTSLRNPRLQQPEEKTRKGMRDLHSVEKDQVREHLKWTYVSPWGLTGCTHEC